MTSDVIAEGATESQSPRLRSTNGPAFGDISPFMFWLILLVVWILSYITQHDFYFSVEGSSATPDLLADAVIEGNLLRRISLPLMALIGFFCLIRYGHRRLRISGRVGWTMLALFLWMIASILWSDDPGLTGRRLIGYACMMICALGMAVAIFERLPQFLVAYCSLTLAVGVLAEVVLGAFHPESAGYRFGGTLHPNLQGVNLSLLILGFIALLSSVHSKQRWLLVGALVGSSLFLLLTQSRTSIGALCVSLLVIFSVKAIRERGPGFLALPFTVISLLVTVLLIGGILNSDATLSNLAVEAITTERDSGDPMSLTGRGVLWQTILDYAAQRPIFGFGYDTFWSADHIEEISNIHQWPINQAHNSYLELLVNLGVVGLCLYAVMLVTAWLTCTRRFLNGNKAYFLSSTALLFVMLQGCLESINVLPIFSNFVAFIVLFHIGFIGGSSQNE